ncbi:tRNA (adenosine(37)-N6)-dimethylallyltransferase MiaA [uncultured Sanguibacteroides sp.]|uniref:tRNA (adenosine(37)-N6)-dimethylallyltransferase MiaA n=1 Tax=uncultured Sanguibacteroides sp. TaxID=1635151 RepID=UPI002601191E|nr:tRNA (adenosine(37)-N6)-dimethylallyltransferase MiaA [uncultured Sanguibacteroides sp.]
MDYNLLSIVGATATGKTALAVRLAAELNGEVISADSRQIYRGMDIGTGKDLSEYEYEGRLIPYHLMDIADAGYRYNLFEYQQDFLKVWEDCKSRNVFPVLCGGSGLYVESILKAYRMTPVPENTELRARLASKSLAELTEILASYKTLHNTTDTDTVKRAIRGIEIAEYYLTHEPEEGAFPEIRSLIVGVLFDREKRRQRITERLQARLKNGMIEEVKGLLDGGVKSEDLIYYGLEYKYITLYLIGRLEYDEMVEKLNIAIHQFAKRQMTWFRKMERDGFDIKWLNGDMPLDEKVDRVKTWLKTT